MDLQTLRSKVRDLLAEGESVQFLSDSTLNDLIQRATERIESDFADDYGPTPRQMYSLLSDTITVDGITLPSDFLRARAVFIGDSIMRYAPPEYMPQESSGQDSTVNVAYYAKLPQLVNDTDTNWLLQTASRVYIYATAVEYSVWNRDEPGDKSGYMEAYVEARDKTARANSPRPSGGWGRKKGVQRGYYSIVGERMIFGDRI